MAGMVTMAGTEKRATGIPAGTGKKGIAITAAMVPRSITEMRGKNFLTH